MRSAGQNHPFLRVSADPGLDFAHQETCGLVGVGLQQAKILLQLSFIGTIHSLYSIIYSDTQKKCTGVSAPPSNELYFLYRSQTLYFPILLCM